MTGAHVLEIQALAGHSDLETTQRYMHLSPQALRGAVSRLQGGLVGRFGDGGDGVETAQQRR
jgi:integrase